MNYLESLLFDQKNKDVKDLIKKALFNYIKEAGGERASAEINTLESMFEEYKELQPSNSLIIFLYSDTFISEICTDILKSYFIGLGYQVELTKISGLSYDPDEFIYQGINSLVENVIELIKCHQKSSIKLAITGGFKAEFAYITLIGSLYDIELYYKHEILRKLLRLPPISIKINQEYYLQYLELFNLVGQSDNYELIIKKFPKAESDLRLKFLIEKVGNSFFFTPSGKIVNEILGKRAIKVFISYTSEKEQSAKKLSKELEKMEGKIYVPITYKEKFNLLHSKPKSSIREACHKNIEECDRFILLIGTEIGSIVDEEEKIAYIDDEFNHACIEEKTILVFIPKNILPQIDLYKSLKKEKTKEELKKMPWRADTEIFDLILKVEERDKFYIEYENEDDIIQGIKNKWQN